MFSRDKKLHGALPPFIPDPANNPVYQRKIPINKKKKLSGSP